jgi:serine/threonine protein kinase/Tol biopolymer transport system component
MPLHLEVGSVLKQYRIGPLLGRGGMGEVYSAEDTKLGRKVAIKLLPPGLAHDVDRLKRFEQEAKAASALNHPSILTIYDVDEVDGHPFLVAEYVEGQTLRERMRAGGLTLRETLDIGGQIANALAAAHAAGIVHRDVKPENIMLREDGLAKLLDFGLAKIAQDLAASTDETVAQVGPETTPGLVMGTTQYMSPEQARGLKVDSRSDIFSLGAVLYEMAAGRAPFVGDTPSDLIAAILHYDPPPVDGAPAELERILQKALEKDRDDRHQSAKDVAVDLRRLRKQLEGSADHARSSPGHGSAAWTSTPKSGAAVTATTSTPTAVAPPMRRSMRLVWGGVVALGALTVIGLAWSGRVGIPWFGNEDVTTAPTSVSFDSMTMEKVTGLGAVSSPAMSDDGKLLAYVVADAGQESISLRQMATGSVVKIAGPTRSDLNNIQFTPDGNFLYYTERTPSTPYRWSVMMIPAFGGTPKQILDGRYSKVTFSPDGKRFSAVQTTDAESKLMIFNADGNGAQDLGTRKGTTPYVRAAWSPLGNLLAVQVIERSEANEVHSWFQIIPVTGTTPIRTLAPTGAPLRAILGLSWSTDESTLIISATAESIAAPPQLLSMRATDGQLQRITKDLNAYSTFAFSRGSGTIATIQSERLGSILVGPIDRADEAKELPSRLSYADGGGGIAWIANNRLAFVRETDFPSIWMMDADGTNPKRLTEGAVSIGPAATPDGQSVFFESDRVVPGVPEIFTVNITDGRVKQLTKENGAYSPSMSPDGRSLFFRDNGGVPAKLRRMPMDGGASTTLLESRGLDNPRLSPDGKWIATVLWESPDAPRNVVVLSSDGSTPRILATNNEPAGSVTWTPDSRGLVYFATLGGQQNLWRVDLAGGPPRQITHFTEGNVMGPVISPDGKRIAFYRGRTETDIVLLKPKTGQ